jgi:hypothetical protein
VDRQRLLGCLLVPFAVGCGAAGARDAGSPADRSAGETAEAESQGASPKRTMLVHRGALFGRHWVRYRVGPDPSWLVRVQQRRSLYLPGRSPFVETHDAVFRVERRGVSPEGYLRYAIELTQATTDDGRGRPPRRLTTFPGLKMTNTITETGGWMESRWEIPEGTPPKALRTAEFLQPRLSFGFPALAMGSGAYWTTEFLGTTTDLKTAKQLKQTIRLTDLDDDQVRFDLEEEVTEQPNRINVAGSGPIDFEGGKSSLKGTVTVQLDRLVAEQTSTVQRRSRYKAGAAADAFVLYQNDERITGASQDSGTR